MRSCDGSPETRQRAEQKIAELEARLLGSVEVSCRGEDGVRVALEGEAAPPRPCPAVFERLAPRRDPANDALRDQVDRERALAWTGYVAGGALLAAGTAWLLWPVAGAESGGLSGAARG